MTVPAVNEAPGIFTYPNSLQAVVVNQDGGYSISTPAARGTYITFFITGAGLCLLNNAEFMDIGGIPPASPWASPSFPVSVQFGGDPAFQAAFAGLPYPGVVQVNAYVYKTGVCKCRFQTNRFSVKSAQWRRARKRSADQPIDTAGVAGKMQTGTEISLGTEVAQNV